MIYCFDIDNTICLTNALDYSLSTPIIERIAKINQLYDAGHTIKLHTARGSETGIDWEQLTLIQLKNWGVKFHQVIMGKPAADFYIDDKGMSDLEFNWETNLA